ncbi:hypothetical protein L0156_18295, partial [bacterium]|nr:hypothetical protein [bacterium]
LKIWNAADGKEMATVKLTPISFTLVCFLPIRIGSFQAPETRPSNSGIRKPWRFWNSDWKVQADVSIGVWTTV